MLSILRKLNVYSLIVGGLLVLGIQQGVAAENSAVAGLIEAENLAVARLIKAEEARQRIQAAGLDTLPNTYDIFKKLNKIKTDGPAATPEQQKIIARSVINNALVISNVMFIQDSERYIDKAFDSLIKQYLAENNKHTLPTRMAYLAISATALYLNSKWGSKNEQEGIRYLSYVYDHSCLDIEKHILSVQERQSKFFVEQLNKFYSLAEKVYTDETNKKEAVNPDALAPEGQPATLMDYPEFYRNILFKMDPALESIEDTKLQIIADALKKHTENVAYESGDAVEQYLQSIKLNQFDVNHLVQMFALVDLFDPFIRFRWACIRRYNWGWTPEEMQATVVALKELSSIVANEQKLPFPEMHAEKETVFRCLEQQHVLGERNIDKIVADDPELKKQNEDFKSAFTAAQAAYVQEKRPIVKEKLLAFIEAINSIPRADEERYERQFEALYNYSLIYGSSIWDLIIGTELKPLMYQIDLKRLGRLSC